MKTSKFFAIGDSHTFMWGFDCFYYHDKMPSMYENVIVELLNAPLAYNLLGETLDDLGKWGEHIFQRVGDLQLEHDISGVLISFGEIDIRSQVIKRSMENNIGIDQSAEIIAERIFVFAKRLYNFYKLPVLIWEPNPVTSYNSDTRFPHVGTEKDRNYANLIVRNYLRDNTAISQTNGEKIYSFGIYDVMCNNFITDHSYFWDTVHVNLKGKDAALGELFHLCQQHQLDFYNYFNR